MALSPEQDRDPRPPALRLLPVFGNDERALARALRVWPWRLRRWITGRRPPRKYRERLEDLLALVQMMPAEWSPEEIRSWLQGPNDYLRGNTPLELVRRGATGEVVQAASHLKRTLRDPTPPAQTGL